MLMEVLGVVLLCGAFIVFWAWLFIRIEDRFK